MTDSVLTSEQWAAAIAALSGARAASSATLLQADAAACSSIARLESDIKRLRELTLEYWMRPWHIGSLRTVPAVDTPQCHAQANVRARASTCTVHVMNVCAFRALRL